MLSIDAALVIDACAHARIAAAGGTTRLRCRLRSRRKRTFTAWAQTRRASSRSSCSTCAPPRAAWPRARRGREPLLSWRVAMGPRMRIGRALHHAAGAVRRRGAPRARLPAQVGAGPLPCVRQAGNQRCRARRRRAGAVCAAHRARRARHACASWGDVSACHRRAHRNISRILRRGGHRVSLPAQRQPRAARHPPPDRPRARRARRCGAARARHARRSAA